MGENQMTRSARYRPDLTTVLFVVIVASLVLLVVLAIWSPHRSGVFR